MPAQNYLELYELQNLIQDRIGLMEHWVKVEIESHRVSGGHHYLNLIQKSRNGAITAKASARIWRNNAGIISRFTAQTGKELEAGLSVTVLALVDFHAVYGLSLTILDIDADCALGDREKERRETIDYLTANGLMERQKMLPLPYLPRAIAVVSSQDAAGYGDFLKHISTNPYGFRFNTTLFQALMQGEKSPSSIASRIGEIAASGLYDLIVILRGGGADSDLFGYDDRALCESIARCPVPIITAIGHERDFHIADMVAKDYCKTPTALADTLIDWVAEIEQQVTDALTGIRFALTSFCAQRDSEIALLETRIKAADPRRILSQGYVLAADADGRVIKSAAAGKSGDAFSLRFRDGRWDCKVEATEHND